MLAEREVHGKAVYGNIVVKLHSRCAEVVGAQSSTSFNLKPWLLQ